MSMKILVSGDVEGNISALFKRVEAVNSKAGPFEMLLCVGSFFGPGNLGWSDYKSGRCKVRRLIGKSRKKKCPQC